MTVSCRNRPVARTHRTSAYALGDDPRDGRLRKIYTTHVGAVIWGSSWYALAVVLSRLNQASIAMRARDAFDVCLTTEDKDKHNAPFLFYTRLNMTTMEAYHCVFNHASTCVH